MKKNKKNNKENKETRGRKSIYNEKFHPQLAKILAEAGKIDREIAKELGVSEVTLNNWKKSHPEFLKALKKGKEIPDDKVERSLFERATGYSHSDTKIFYDSKLGKSVIVPIIKHYAPDPTSMIFWLKNRRPDRWRDKQEVDHNMSDEIVQIINSIFSKRDKKLK